MWQRLNAWDDEHDESRYRARRKAGRVSEMAEVDVVLGRFWPLLDHGLTSVLLADDFSHIVASGLSARAVRRVVEDGRADVALLDGASRVPAAGFTSQTIVLAHRPTETHGLFLFAAGVSCVAWSAAASVIVAAVHSVARGGRLFVPDEADPIISHEPPSSSPLTMRERDVLEELSQRRSYAQIAATLGISEETVRCYAAKLRRKLEVNRSRDFADLSL